jgi:O-antigen/teichoic acid export membrane protein
MELQNRYNFTQLLFFLCKHACTYFYIFYIDNKASWYVLIFTIFTILEWAYNYKLIFTKLSCNKRVFNFELINAYELLKKTARLSIAVIFGSLVTQIDKIILSSKISVSEFGQYVVITNLGLAMMQLQAPIFKAFFPKLASSTDNKIIHNIFFKIVIIIFIFCILPVFLILINSHLTLELWTRDISFADKNYFLLELICTSVLLNYIYNFIYHLFLIKGDLSIILYINIFAFAIITPTLYLLTNNYGVTAGGASWILLSLLQLFIGSLWLLKHHSKSQR